MDYYQSLFEKLLDEENDDPIELETENGHKVTFEQIAVVNYKEEPYAILRPADSKNNQVVVFKLDLDDEDHIDLVMDDKLAEAVLEVYNNDIDE